MLESGHETANGQDSVAAAAAAVPAQPEASTAALVIGQATAVLAVAGAVVYAAGGLSLGLKLWYDQYSWEPVLGQLPGNFLLVNAIIVIAPAIIIGLLAYVVYDKLGESWLPWLRKGATPWWASALIAAALGGVPLAFLPFVRRTTLHGVIRPYWQIFIVCLILDFIFVRLAFYLLPRTHVKGLQGLLGVGVLVLAFIPAVASVSATSRFPIVELCGPAFGHQGKYGHYAIGNLIGTNGQWAYVAETLTHSPKPNEYIFAGGYIAVIPLSAVQLESIGSDATCGDLHP
jgi:hypothetical protein